MNKAMNILEQAIETYGKDKQQIVAIEELAELQKEITKQLRGIGNTDHLAEEMADVYIMLNQLEIMYDNLDDMQKWVDYKMERLKGRLNG